MLRYGLFNNFLNSDYKDDGTNILLDANENAYGPGLSLNEDGKLAGTTSSAGNGIDVDLLGLNRYPDPYVNCPILSLHTAPMHRPNPLKRKHSLILTPRSHQNDLKQLLCNLRNTNHHTSTLLTPANLFTGVGSDEAIDALLRAFCIPSTDSILVCPPTYGMYSVSAQVNDISLTRIPLLLPSFQLDVPSILSTLSNTTNIKLAYLCSPGNPTAALLKKEDIEQVLQHPTWNGVVVVDEAYIDFAPEGSSVAQLATQYPNLVVMQTLSKAFGLAGIRLGAAFTSPEIARLLNALKAPYNISNPTSQIACQALRQPHLDVMRTNVAKILEQRHRLLRELPQIPGVGKFLGGTDSNFLLVEMLDKPLENGGKPSNETALGVYEGLAEEKGVVVRFRGKEYGCEGCLRITVGTEKEVDRFLGEIRNVLKEIFEKKGHLEKGEEERKEVEASKIIA